LNYRDHNYLGITQSLCPQCLTLVQAKVVVRDNRVYFRKHCPAHGTREDFVCSDATMFDRYEYSLPGKVPSIYGAEVTQGCPYDCGLCSEHEQHTCIGLLEITQHCNLKCPLCFGNVLIPTSPPPHAVQMGVTPYREPMSLAHQTPFNKRRSTTPRPLYWPPIFTRCDRWTVRPTNPL
jgi:hypothetical protein